VEVGNVLTCWLDSLAGVEVHASFRIPKHLMGGCPDMNGDCGIRTFMPFQRTSLSCFIVEVCTDGSPSDRLELGQKI
jgi:hypothetical protein